MQDSKSNPPHVLCKMLSIKSKISDLKTSRVINTNRKLSEKVRSCLTNIEKDWVINENRSISAKRSYMCNDTSRSYSPISAYSTSRSISPIIFTNDTKFSSNLGISHDYIEENEEKQLWVKKLKEKEEALDIITSLKQTQEDQLKKTISEYREKIFGLEEERNDILKLKAKVFAEVRKLKEIENSLKIRENAIRKEPKNSMYGEEDAAYLLTEKNKISQLTRKINEDFDLIYHEKIELSKVKTLLTYKHEAVKVIWPEILDLLASYKCIKP